MGLRDILTKPINFGSTVMQWNEPMLYPLRLKGDLWLRALVILGVWAGMTGVMLALFSFNVNPPGILTAIGLGAVFGLGPAFLLTMMLRDHVGGSVKIRKNDIYMQRQYASMAVFIRGWIEYGEWPFSTIGKCVIVPGQRINKSFSVMLLSVGSGTIMLGIPGKIDLKKLAGFLSGKGVTVTPGQSVPSAFRKPLNLFVGLSIPALAMLFFLAGTALYVVRVGLPGVDNQLAHREQLQEHPDLTVTPPTLSNLPLGRSGGPASVADGSGESDTTQPELDAPTSSAPQFTPGFGFGGPRAGATTAPSETVPSSAGRRTATVGGTGGIPFETIDRQNRPVIGIRSRMGEWAGTPHVATLEPLFESASTGRDESVQLARDGYALGALDVSGTDFVDAVRPVFMRKTDDGLDADDSYDGEWLGAPTEALVTRLSGDGVEVIGFYGRGAAVLDAAGLILRD